MLRFLHKILPCQNLFLFQTGVCLKKGMEFKMKKLGKCLKKYNFITIFLIIIMCGIIVFYQSKKVGFHEDEVYTLCSSVNPDNGLMAAYDDWEKPPVWRTKEYVKKFTSLEPKNYLNFKALYMNQAYDNHPPVFYTFVHFSSIIFGGKFNIYTVFVVNIIAFIFTCIVLSKILKLLNKENLIYSVLILYGLCMGTISIVIFQRMYMLLTFFTILYFYLNLKIYKNDFKLDIKIIIQLGITAVLGFLTQYFFAIFALFIFVIMLVEGIFKRKDKSFIKKYIISHLIYAVIGVLLFVPCIKHLLFSDRGLSNLKNASYFKHMLIYIKHLAYMFSIKEYYLLVLAGLVVFFIILINKNKEEEQIFLTKIFTIPSLMFFLITVKLTSFQELRYIAQIIPFIVLYLFLILDRLVKTKYKNIIFISISVFLVVHGFVISSPKFLYRNYQDYLEIAKENSEKSFIYVYDNIFNHIQSIPEMMIYNKTLIINKNKDELKYVIKDKELNKANSYILCIKSYLNNEEILSEITKNSEFKNVKVLIKNNCENYDDKIENNLYLISK